MAPHHPLINNAAEMRSKVRVLICSSHPSLYKATCFLDNGFKSASIHVVTCVDDKKNDVVIRCWESQFKTFSPGLVACSRALSQPLIMFWRVLYHQRCTQQSHVLTHLVSPEVQTQKSRFDLWACCCITNTQNVNSFPRLFAHLYESQKLCHPCTLYARTSPVVRVIRTHVRSSVGRASSEF